ncbi:MAG TPA: NAD(+) diphosphatase [Micromonosporaceae bacterium]|nr:NAD(+) diphosphatase [Micromonosporaceae bacterium]
MTGTDPAAAAQLRPPLDRGGPDRAAERRRDAAWLAQAWERARVLVVSAGKVLVHDKPARLLFCDAATAPDGERLFLGVDDGGTPYFAVATDAAPGADAGEGAGARPAGLREIGEDLPDDEVALVVTAVALDQWHRRHGYSPRTGAPTTAGDGGWTRVTRDGADTLWPRTDPAVIALVHDGVAGPQGRCLLGHKAEWTTTPGWARRYSCLAGFVEPGESAEATVVREVFEEVGVQVRDVRYVASQPWPFPGSLMLAFTARAEPGAEIRVDDDEISDARWFTRTQIAAALAGDEEFSLPFGLSIASFLITAWLGSPTPADL